jgi:hypothetical protein
MSKLGHRALDLDAIAAVLTEKDSDTNWELTKSGDEHFIKRSSKVKWLSWNDDGTFKDDSEQIEIGRSLLMSPFNVFFTWQTTPIRAFVASSDGNEIVFSTKNSNYTLTRINNVK